MPRGCGYYRRTVHTLRSENRATHEHICLIILHLNRPDTQTKPDFQGTTQDAAQGTTHSAQDTVQDTAQGTTQGTTRTVQDAAQGTAHSAQDTGQDADFATLRHTSVPRRGLFECSYFQDSYTDHKTAPWPSFLLGSIVRNSTFEQFMYPFFRSSTRSFRVPHTGFSVCQ